MELQQLRYFQSIADAGTISGAARKLHMTQPPLSQQLKLLEEEFGTPLFTRTARQMILTDAGRHLYKRAEDILGLVRITDQEMENHREGKNGILRIGVVSSAEKVLLDAYVHPFAAGYPDITYELTEGNTYELLDMLKANRIDFAMIRTPFEQDEQLNVRVLKKEKMAAAGRRSFFRKEAEDPAAKIPLKSLLDLPLLIYRRWEPLLRGYVETRNERAAYFCVCDDARTAVSWADKGLGVAIVPESAGSYFASPDIVIRELADPSIRSDICAVMLKKTQMSAAMRLFGKLFETV